MVKRKSGFFKSLNKDLGNKKKRKDAFIFLGLFLIFFVLIYFIFSFSFIYSAVNYFFGYFSSLILGLFFQSSFYFDAFLKMSIITVSGIDLPITLGRLCTGILEFAILSAAILASKGIAWKRRITGVLLAGAVVAVFNIFRIVTTAIIIKLADIESAEFFHGFLFRLFLVVIVIGTYWLWYKKAS